MSTEWQLNVVRLLFFVVVFCYTAQCAVHSCSCSQSISNICSIISQVEMLLCLQFCRLFIRSSHHIFPLFCSVPIQLCRRPSFALETACLFEVITARLSCGSEYGDGAPISPPFTIVSHKINQQSTKIHPIALWLWQNKAAAGAAGCWLLAAWQETK